MSPLIGGLWSMRAHSGLDRCEGRYSLQMSPLHHKADVYRWILTAKHCWIVEKMLHISSLSDWLMNNIWGEMLKDQVHNKCVSSGKSNSSMFVHLVGHIKTRNSSTGSKVDKRMKKSRAEMHSCHQYSGSLWNTPLLYSVSLPIHKLCSVPYHSVWWNVPIVPLWRLNPMKCQFEIQRKRFKVQPRIPAREQLSSGGGKGSRRRKEGETIGRKAMCWGRILRCFLMFCKGKKVWTERPSSIP